MLSRFLTMVIGAIVVAIASSALTAALSGEGGQMIAGVVMIALLGALLVQGAVNVHRAERWADEAARRHMERMQALAGLAEASYRAGAMERARKKRAERSIPERFAPPPGWIAPPVDAPKIPGEPGEEPGGKPLSIAPPSIAPPAERSPDSVPSLAPPPVSRVEPPLPDPFADPFADEDTDPGATLTWDRTLVSAGERRG